MKPLLDLFCCAGGAARGYANAGFDVVGIDIEPQPRYPYTFFHADVMELDPEWIAEYFCAVHASPPCQGYTELRHLYTTNEHPLLIEPTRLLLQKTGLPYIIENVDDARTELVDPIVLCGLMFPPLRVIRDRWFETTFPVEQPFHPSHYSVRCHTFDKRKSHYGETDEWVDFVQVTGGGNCSVAAAADAMGLVDLGLIKRELNEAIPPAYTEYIGHALMAHLKETTCHD